MATCCFCGKEFDPSYARRSMGKRFGAGIYNEYFPEGDVCENCAFEQIGTDYAEGAEIAELMGDSWWDD